METWPLTKVNNFWCLERELTKVTAKCRSSYLMKSQKPLLNTDCQEESLPYVWLIWQNGCTRLSFGDVKFGDMRIWLLLMNSYRTLWYIFFNQRRSIIMYIFVDLYLSFFLMTMHILDHWETDSTKCSARKRNDIKICKRSKIVWHHGLLPS